MIEDVFPIAEGEFSIAMLVYFLGTSRMDPHLRK